MGRRTETQGNSTAADEKHKVDRRNIELSLLFRGIADAEFRPQVQPHAFTDQGKGSADQRLAGNGGGGSGNQDSGDQEPGWHDAVENIVVSGIKNLSHMTVQEPGPLAQVVQDQTGFYIDPRNPDIAFSAMAQVGIQGFGPRGTEENRTQQPESLRINGQQFNGIK